MVSTRKRVSTHDIRYIYDLGNSSGTCSKSSEVVMMSELAASLDDGGRDARETR